MTFSSQHSLAGQFLIAMPALATAPFARGVALICQHDENGAMGLLINRPSAYRMGEVFAQMTLTCHDTELTAAPVLIGGPVEPERGFVLHREPGTWASSHPVCDGWSVTTSRDILIAMAQGKGPPLAVMTLGYAGWGAGQLEQEVKDNAWLTVQASEQVVFRTPVAERWSAAAKLVGVDLLAMPGYAGHA